MLHLLEKLAHGGSFLHGDALAVAGSIPVAVHHIQQLGHSRCMYVCMYVCMQGPTNTLASVPLALSALAALAILASAVPSASQAGDLCQGQVGRTYPQSDPWKSSSCCGWLYLHPHYITNAHRKREG